MLTDEALERIGRLYAVQRVAKLHGFDADGVREMRQSSARPMLVELREWLESTQPKVLGKSPLAKARASSAHRDRQRWRSIVRS